MATSKSARKPGPQQPQKYAPYEVGKNYRKWGEQAGYVYVPWKDQYVPDPQAAKEYGERTGIVEKEKKAPGIFEQAAAVALPALASKAGLLGLEYGLNEFFPPDPKPFQYLGDGRVLMSDLSIKNLDLDTGLSKGLLSLDSDRYSLPTSEPTFSVTDASIPEIGGGDIEFDVGATEPGLDLSPGYSDMPSLDAGSSAPTLTVDDADSGGFWDWLTGWM